MTESAAKAMSTVRAEQTPTGDAVGRWLSARAKCSASFGDRALDSVRYLDPLAKPDNAIHHLDALHCEKPIDGSRVLASREWAKRQSIAKVGRLCIALLFGNSVVGVLVLPKGQNGCRFHVGKRLLRTTPELVPYVQADEWNDPWRRRQRADRGDCDVGNDVHQLPPIEEDVARFS